MRRRSLLLLVLLALLATVAFMPGRADAKGPCRNKIFNDWYRDGKIASTYPISCYRDALKHIPPDVAVYTGLTDDIRFALQAAINRSHGKPEPAQVSSTLTSSNRPSSDDPSTSTKHHSPTSTAPTSPDPGSMTTTTKAPTPVVAVPAASSSSNGVPVPVLVLGGIALVLVASGGIGLGVRRFRRG